MATPRSGMGSLAGFTCGKGAPIRNVPHNHCDSADHWEIYNGVGGGGVTVAVGGGWRLVAVGGWRLVVPWDGP